MGLDFIALVLHVFAMVTIFASVVSTFTPLTALNRRQLEQNTYNSLIMEAPSIPQRYCSAARQRYRAAVNDDANSENGAAVNDDANSENPVQVFDNVVSPVVANVLHYLAFEQSLRSNGDTCLFVRQPYNTKPLTPLENFIDSVLTTLETPASADCRVVEYWSREEYMNIKAHADIDENSLHYGGLDCPKASHILYLSVQDGLKGPTCIFPTEKGSWTTATTDKESVVDLITIPAVPGRMVKLPGNAMHAVPCPPTRWLLKQEEEHALTQREEEEEDGWEDEEDGEAEDDKTGELDDDEDVIERSVILFNTWSGDGPKGVKGDHTDIWPDGIGLDKDNNSEAKGLVEEWQEDYGIHAERIHCLAKSDWKETLVYKAAEEASSSSPKEQLRIPLMGDETRRGVPNETVLLQVPVGALQDAVEQESRATQLRLLN
jgi:hypothetical protein